jgi:rhodanese-related sulfurtransferase
MRMTNLRPLLLLSATCLCFHVSMPAQTGAPAANPAGGRVYLQALIKEAKARIHEIGNDQLETVRKASPAAVLVDVREDREWDKNRIPGAIHVGRGVLEASIESRVPQNSTPIVVYCQSGGRSALAADVLQKMGYTNVSSLSGGMSAYQAAGLPVDTSSPPK